MGNRVIDKRCPEQAEQDERLESLALGGTHNQGRVQFDRSSSSIRERIASRTRAAPHWLSGAAHALDCCCTFG
jgi:hypothetical protein